MIITTPMNYARSEGVERVILRRNRSRVDHPGLEVCWAYTTLLAPEDVERIVDVYHVATPSCPKSLDMAPQRVR